MCMNITFTVNARVLTPIRIRIIRIKLREEASYIIYFLYILFSHVIPMCMYSGRWSYHFEAPCILCFKCIVLTMWRSFGMALILSGGKISVRRFHTIRSIHHTQCRLMVIKVIKHCTSYQWHIPGEQLTFECSWLSHCVRKRDEEICDNCPEWYPWKKNCNIDYSFPYLCGAKRFFFSYSIPAVIKKCIMR